MSGNLQTAASQTIAQDCGGKKKERRKEEGGTGWKHVPSLLFVCLAAGGRDTDPPGRVGVGTAPGSGAGRYQGGEHCKVLQQGEMQNARKYPGKRKGPRSGGECGMTRERHVKHRAGFWRFPTECCPRVVALHLHVRASRAVGPAPSYPILSDPIPSCPVPSPQEGGSARLQAAPAHGWLTASSCPVHLGSNSGLQDPRGGCRVGPREPVAAPRGSAVGTGHDPVLPSHEKRGVLLASAEQQSRVCELAAGLCFCCPESKVMTEFLRKKTDWETEDCSMHLLVSQKAQAQHAPSAASGCMTGVPGGASNDPGGTNPSLVWQRIHTPGSALA